MSKTQTTKRARSRKIAVAEQTPIERAKGIAASVYFANRAMNEAKAKHDKLRKELYSLMKEMGTDTLQLTANDSDGNISPLEAEISCPTTQAVDKVKLLKLVSKDQFIAMATVTQAAIKSGVGSSVLNQVLVPKVGTENVSVHTV